MIIQPYEGIRIIATYSCKQNCKFCYQKIHHSCFLNPEKLENQIKKIDFIPVYFTFMGGELSYYPEKTYKIMEIVHKNFPMVYSKSLTTNGIGTIDWYQSLKNVGITRFNFSLHNINASENILSKIEKIGRSYFYTIRINCFLDIDNFENAKEIVNFCFKKDIPLTLCCDINKKENNKSKIKEIIPKLCNTNNYIYKKYNNYYIVEFNNYHLWIFIHDNNYLNNNLIILPNGSFTNNFEDVKNCKGNI